MYKEKRILAIIPARGGSKGIKNKNIVDLCGKPLISYTIEAAKKSKYIDKVIVSTDSDKIANVSEKFGAEVPFKRPEYLSTDTAKSIEVVLHSIEELKKNNNTFDYCILLQPTQPLRKTFHTDEAIEKIIDSNKESLVSVCEVDQHPILMRKIDDNGTLQNLIEGSSTIRRQDFEKVYFVNGAIYINKISEMLDINTSLNDNEIPYVMDRKYSVDIDEAADLELAKYFISYQDGK